MIVDVPVSPGCTHSRMGGHPICSPASVAPSDAKEEEEKTRRSRSQAGEVRAARHAQSTVFQERKNGSRQLGGGGEEHSVVIFWVLTLGCEILSVLPPASSLTPAHLVSIFCLSSLLPLSPPLLCPGPVRATADDSQWQKKETARATGSHGKGSRRCMFPVSHDGGAARRRLYDCDFKLCILHVTGNKY